jgi:plastocyanin domain-containing protein
MRILLGLLLLGFPLAACGGSSDNADATETEAPPVEAVEAEAPENLQIVQVRVEGDAYLFSPVSVQVGNPVRLVFDPAGLPGCSKDVAIPDFEIAKVISAEDATIDFTPEAQGPVAIACSMNMYRGTLLVE